MCACLVLKWLLATVDKLKDIYTYKIASYVLIVALPPDLLGLHCLNQHSVGFCDNGDELWTISLLRDLFCTKQVIARIAKRL